MLLVIALVLLLLATLLLRGHSSGLLLASQRSGTRCRHDCSRLLRGTRRRCWSIGLKIKIFN